MDTVVTWQGWSYIIFSCVDTQLKGVYKGREQQGVVMLRDHTCAAVWHFINSYTYTCIASYLLHTFTPVNGGCQNIVAKKPLLRACIAFVVYVDTYTHCLPLCFKNLLLYIPR